jgi:hypothetical protein
MTFSDPVDPAPRSFAADLLYAVRYYFGGRIGLVAIAAVALGLGAYYNWGWLVAIGLAPILVSALPCVAMCAPADSQLSSWKHHLAKIKAGRMHQINQPAPHHVIAMAAADDLLKGRKIMRMTIRTIGMASLIIGSLAIASSIYAQEQKQPSMDDMMKGGGMDGMMGMMEQMSRMMGICTKMMESGMEGTDKKMPMESPAGPEKKG